MTRRRLLISPASTAESVVAPLLALAVIVTAYGLQYVLIARPDQTCWAGSPGCSPRA